MDYIKALKWRYAVKKFDYKRKISDLQLKNILKATHLSPSSYGIQSYNIIIIKNLKLRKEKLQPLSSNIQITEASHLILFAIQTNLNKTFIDKHINYVKNIRELPIDSLKFYKESIINFIKQLTKQEKENWQIEQIYIALGTLLYYCALNKIDTCPIGGFSKKGFDEILKLKEKKLKSVILVALGYRDKNDKNQHYKKIRRPLSEILLEY